MKPCARCNNPGGACVCGEYAYELIRVFVAHDAAVDAAARGGLAAMDEAADRVLLAIEEAKTQVDARRARRRVAVSS